LRRPGLKANGKVSRQSPPRSAPVRPLTATASATVGFADAFSEGLVQSSPGVPPDPDLAAVMSAWPTLPGPIRAGILAMVKATGVRE
jgi:hypothetical protein